MATTNITTSSGLSATQWANGALMEGLSTTIMAPFMGKGEDSAIIMLEDLRKSKGDTIVKPYLRLFDSTPLGEGVDVEANAKAHNYLSDSFVINICDWPVRFENVMSTQRSTVKLQEDARKGIGFQIKEYLDRAVLNHLAGYTPAATIDALNNAPAAPSDTSYHQIWSDAGAVSSTLNDEGLTTGDKMSTTLLDKARQLAETAQDGGYPLIRPCKTPFGRYYVNIMSPHQLDQLRSSTTSMEWADITKAQIQGGDVKNNPMLKRFVDANMNFIGTWNGIALFSSYFVPQGVNSSTGAAISGVRRSVFFGAQAGLFGMGAVGGSTPNAAQMIEKDVNMGREKIVTGRAVMGGKKFQVTIDGSAVDVGTIVISTSTT